MAEYIELLQTELAGQFLNPKKRLFWGYLCSAFFLALCWLCFFERQRLKNAIKIIASPAIWLSKSSKADMICFVINRVFFYFFGPILITQIIIATALYQALHYQTFLPLGIFSHSPYWLSAGLFTCCFFLLDDLSRFALHLALHKIPIFNPLIINYDSLLELSNKLIKFCNDTLQVLQIFGACYFRLTKYLSRAAEYHKPLIFQQKICRISLQNCIF